MKAVIFDMDGVILDSEPIYDADVILHLQELGIKATEEVFEKTRGTTVIEFWAFLKETYQLQNKIEDLVAESMQRMDEHFQFNEHVKPMADLEDFIIHVESLKRRMAVASASHNQRISIIHRKSRWHEMHRICRLAKK